MKKADISTMPNTVEADNVESITSRISAIIPAISDYKLAYLLGVADGLANRDMTQVDCSGDKPD